MTYVYLHGFASSPRSRKAQFFAERFAAAGLRLETPDLEEGNFEGLTLTRQLALTGRLLDGAREITVIGSSMGGYLAALLAAREPERVKKVVMLAPAFRFAKRWSEDIERGRLARWREDGFLEMYHYGYKENRRIGYQLIADAQAYEDFPDVRQPALILHGVDDAVVPAAFSREFAKGRGNVRLVLLESGHELTDVLDALWSETARFLEIG